MWDHLTKRQEQFEQHVALFDRNWLSFPVALEFLLSSRIHNFETVGAIDRAVNVHGPKIERLNEDKIEKNLENAGLLQIIKESPLFASDNEDPKAQLYVDEFCYFVDSHKIDLKIINIPVAPFYQKLMDYSFISQYERNVKGFSKYSKIIALDTFEKYGLGNRHYVNRMLNDEYDYNVWQSVSSEGRQSIDGTHLSVYGATVFTSQAIDALHIQ